MSLALTFLQGAFIGFIVNQVYPITTETGMFFFIVFINGILLTAYGEAKAAEKDNT
jgi:hypothetical protein